MYDLNKAVLVFDLKFKKEIDDKLMVDKISEIISDWNSTKSYHLTNSNCQHFVNEILEKLGLYNEDGDLKKMMNIMKEKGSYSLNDLLPQLYKLNLKNHKDLDYEQNMRIWNGTDRNSEFNLKPLDRAIWLNFYIFKIRLEFFMKTRDECNVSLKKLNSYNEKIIRNALIIATENSFFQYKFPDFISPLLTHIGELNEGADYQKQKPEIKKNLKELYTKAFQYTNEKIKELQTYLLDAEPITTSEMIKRYLKENLEEVEFAKIYPKDDVFPCMEDVDMNHPIIKKIPRSSWSNLKFEHDNNKVDHHCPFENPSETHSFIPNKLYPN
jgi:predicted house-cleaning noncanonical NTP pyrophosphatase (MazG superfamily)